MVNDLSSEVRAGKGGRRRSLPWLLGCYGAPAVLLLLAAFQTVQTRRDDLSPWKGGGFGMFSTVDSPRARFVRVYLETGDGEAPVPLPDAYAYRLQKIQTFPSPAVVEGLARDLASATWVVPDLPWFEPDVPAAETLGTSESSEGDPPTPTETPPGLLVPLPTALSPGELSPRGFTQIHPRAVRVEVWRYRFDQEAVRIEVERLVDAREAVPGTAGGGIDG